MKRILLFVCAVVLMTQIDLLAQKMSMNYSKFQAQGELNENISSDPSGFSFNYIHDLNERPWSVGAELGVAMYSLSKFNMVDANGQEFTVNEEDCFWTIQALSQYRVFQSEKMIVFTEGRIGLSTFFSEQYTTNVDVEFESTAKTHGTAFNVGAGGGLQFNMSGLFTGDYTANNSIWLTSAYTASSGTRTKYRQAEPDSNSLEVGTYKSLTDYTNFRVGLTFFLPGL